jgi:alpha-beta hydrolase superfamily lysophospholipase
MSFGEFNRGFEPARTPFDWLSRDEAEVDDYVKDPLCGFMCTTQLWVDMLGSVSALQKSRSYKWTRPDLPVLIIAGDQDPVSRGGRTFGRMVRVFRKAGIQSVRVKTYPGGRHELLHETNRSEVVEDLINWLDDLMVSSNELMDQEILPESDKK